MEMKTWDHDLDSKVELFFNLIDGRGTAKAEDAKGTPTQSYTSPSILVYEDIWSRQSGQTGLCASPKLTQLLLRFYSQA